MNKTLECGCVMIIAMVTWPSDEHEKASVPCLDARNLTEKTGSRWLFSIGDTSTGLVPLRGSKMATCTQIVGETISHTAKEEPV